MSHIQKRPQSSTKRSLPLTLQAPWELLDHMARGPEQRAQQPGPAAEDPPAVGPTQKLGL